MSTVCHNGRSLYQTVWRPFYFVLTYRIQQCNSSCVRRSTPRVFGRHNFCCKASKG